MVESIGVKNKPTVPAVAGDPGYGLGIAGFIVSFFSGVIGLVMSAVALNQSKRAGKRNTLAFVGVIIGIVRTALEVLAVLGAIIGLIFLVNYCAENQTECQSNSDSGNGQYDQQGQAPETGGSGTQKTY